MDFISIEIYELQLYTKVITNQIISDHYELQCDIQ